MKKIIMVMMAFLVSFAIAASDQTVMVSGSATEKKPSSEAYEDALRNALIAAVEKNLGTWLNSQSSSVSFSSTNEFAQAKHDIFRRLEIDTPVEHELQVLSALRDSEFNLGERLGERQILANLFLVRRHSFLSFLSNDKSLSQEKQEAYCHYAFHRSP